MRLLQNLATTVSIFMILILALAYLPTSGAISQGTMSRGISAITSADANGLLRLVGFDNQTLIISNVNKKYFYTGRITNDGREAITLKIKALPDFSLVTNKAYSMSIRIGGRTLDFTFSNHAAQELTFTVESGGALDVEISLTGNQAREVLTIFEFTATSASGSYQMHLLDTPATPRRMVLK